ncbi:UNVERIFIED_CONTAM: hypothetical protein Sradi_5195300 [Sesamum radiatum]|uniref:Uncharacterized protein n=1 Tax=Sesamum radiatum TaxID=300843 RepID=A0AAW2M6U2_SESRA
MALTVNESHKLGIGESGYKSVIDIETAGVDPSKLDDVVLDGEVLPDNGRNSESHQGNGDALHPAAKYSTNRNDKEDVNAYALNFTVILKKVLQDHLVQKKILLLLIDLGKVNAKDVASEIGVSPDSLNAILDDNHMVPELQCKLLRWLKNHAHIGNLQKTLKVKIRSLVAPKPVADAAEGVGTVSIEESSISDAVPIKSVPPRRRTKSSIRNVKDDNSFSFRTRLMMRQQRLLLTHVFLSGKIQMSLVDPEQHQDDLPKDSIRIEDELRALAQSLYEDDLYGETKQSRQMTNCSLILTNGEVNHSSYVHPFIYSKMMQSRSNMLDKTPFYQSGVPKDQEASQLEASSSSGLCCSNNSAQATSDGWTFGCNGVNLDQLVKATNLDMLKLSPADDVEGELIYYQTRLLCNAAARKRISGLYPVLFACLLFTDLWLFILGKERASHKEAQAVLAAATAAAAASSRISSIRKDAVEESSQQEDRAKTNVSERPGFYSQLNRRVKETLSRSATARSSFDTNSDSAQLASDFSKDHPRTCDVAVHLDCYRSVKSTTGPWHCELCEHVFSSRGSGALATNSWEKPYFVAECGLCGGTAGAFRKSIDGQWIHALCAEWVLESTYRRGQVNPIEGMDTVCRGVDTCTVCRRKQGVCLKVKIMRFVIYHTYLKLRFSYNGPVIVPVYSVAMVTARPHFILLVLDVLADTHRHGIEEFKSLKQVRVELERLRLLCERIIKREKLKRELVLCSHDILASSRDSVLSALARHPFYQPEVSSESATTSIKGYTDGYKSGSDMVQRSDDITVDSAVAGKRRVKFPMSVENDQRTDDSSTSQNLYTLKPMERVSFSGKQIPQRLSAASRNISDDLEKRTKYRKHAETFEKELIMTSDQASVKNQRLPKGFVYVPVRCLSKDKETVPDACSREPMERNG